MLHLPPPPHGAGNDLLRSLLGERMTTAFEAKVEDAKSVLSYAAQLLCEFPEDETAWRNLCRARATLRALARCAR